LEILPAENKFTLRKGSARNPYDVASYKNHILGIPRCKTPWKDMMAGKINWHLIQTQPNIVCYVNFSHQMEEIQI
jgi:hypothetical protein